MGGEGVGRGRGHRLWVARKANTKVKNDRIVHDTCGVDEEVTVEDDINEKKKQTKEIECHRPSAMADFCFVDRREFFFFVY